MAVSSSRGGEGKREGRGEMRGDEGGREGRREGTRIVEITISMPKEEAFLSRNISIFEVEGSRERECGGGVP